MGGCTFPFFSKMGFFSGGLLSILVWGLLIAGLIYVGIRVTRSLGSANQPPHRDTHDSLDIAKQRFARGEITEEEYARMKEVLLQ